MLGGGREGEGGTIPSATLSPPECLYAKMDSDDSRFNVSLSVISASRRTVMRAILMFHSL